jgi:1,4-alpha-glucan branching enzyme
VGSQPFGGRENLAAIELLQELNKAVYEEFPDVQTIAEESTSWPMVSKPVYLGGLGFGLKWNMGWMNDSLTYMELDPILSQIPSQPADLLPVVRICRKFCAASVPRRGCLREEIPLSKMPGDYWQKMAGLRLFGYMYRPAGQEAALHGRGVRPVDEWNHDWPWPGSC